MNVQKELMSIPEFGGEDEEPFSGELKAVSNFKKAILMTAGAAVQKLMMKLESEQEIIINIANMAIETFTAESALLRVMKLAAIKGESEVSFEADMVKTYITDAADKINKYGKDAVNAFAEGDEQRMMLLGIKRFTKTEPYNTKAARRRIAEKLVADGKYHL